MGAQLPKIPDWWGHDLNGVRGEPHPAQDASSAALVKLPDKPITSANLIGSTPEDISRKAADWAKSQVGNTDYQYWDTSDKTGGDRSVLPWGLGGFLTPKCNVFVGDAFAKAGIQINNPRDNGAAYPGTEEWASGKAQVPGFRLVGPKERLQPGDVMTDGHHVGIYAPGLNGEDMTVSAAFLGRGNAVVHNRWGFRGDEGAMTVRRFVGTP